MESLSPWTWAIIAVVLVIAELLSFTFFLCFLAFGALVTAVTTGLGATVSISSQLAVFCAAAILSTVLLRKTAKRLFFGQGDMSSEHLGQQVKVIETIPEKGEGKVEYRGSRWIAFSDQGAEIPEGTLVTVVAVDGVRLKVRP
jgi:membrane protein implicated in regulation of membrane protease activity